MPPSECLTENDVARFIEGTLDGENLASAEGHLATCEACLSLVADAASSLADDEAESTPARPDLPLLVAGVAVGRYVILEPVGAGAMGRVYAAHDPVLDRKVALKLLHSHATAPELEARLLREAKAMARLVHPEVITVHDVGRFGTQLFIAMEFVDGGTLRQWLAGGTRTWREIVDTFLRAGRGLSRAHASGIVHRDFKPDNVLVGSDGRVRVTDFGLALTAQAGQELTGGNDGSVDLDESAPLTQTGMFVGTPAYMAPEQLAGQPADARSDLYGFCVALWEALYGERPHRGKSLRELRAEKMKSSPRATRTERGVPARVRRTLLVGLRPLAADRHPSMDALLVELARASRTPILPWLGGAAAVLAVAGGATYAANVARHRSAPVVAVPQAECTSGVSCVESHGGEPMACRASDHTCVALASEDCVPEFEPEDLRAADTVWIGALLPAKGPRAAAFGKMHLDAAELARQEIARATSPLTGANASIRVPHIALIACDDSADPLRAARHLVDDSGVQAILGFSSGKELIDLAGSLLIQKHVLTMATVTENPAISRLPQPADLRVSCGARRATCRSRRRRRRTSVHDVFEPPKASRVTRVVLLRDDNATPFAEALYRTLVINGRPAVEARDNYAEIVLHAEDPSHSAETRVVAARPTVVVLDVGDVPHGAEMATRIERGWPEGTPRPVYVFVDYWMAALRDFIGVSQDLRRRVVSVTSVAAAITENRFLMRFDAAFPGEATKESHPGPTYDAFYALAYAVFATAPGAGAGPDLSRALARFASSGRRIETGPTDLLTGIAALARGESIDLEGRRGPRFRPGDGGTEQGFHPGVPGYGCRGEGVARRRVGAWCSATTSSGRSVPSAARDLLATGGCSLRRSRRC